MEELRIILDTNEVKHDASNFPIKEAEVHSVSSECSDDTIILQTISEARLQATLEEMQREVYASLKAEFLTVGTAEANNADITTENPIDGMEKSKNSVFDYSRPNEYLTWKQKQVEVETADVNNLEKITYDKMELSIMDIEKSKENKINSAEEKSENLFMNNSMRQNEISAQEQEPVKQIEDNLDEAMRLNPCFTCSLCTIKYVSFESLKTHCIAAHNCNVTLKYTPIYKCKSCDCQFDTAKQLHRHEGLQCEICKESFCHPSVLKRHKSTHSKLSCPCPNCGKVYKTSKTLRQHIKTQHTSPKPATYYLCDECNNTYQSIRSLLRHKKLHQSFNILNVKF